MPAGTQATKDFYDREGWQLRDQKTVEAHLFSAKEQGPIRAELHKSHLDRIRVALLRAGDRVKLLECGCGGHPETRLFDGVLHYTGVDFSQLGLKQAQALLERQPVPFELSVADVCHLPFSDGQFDAIYSAHMLYHIDDPSSQRAALKEMLRVLRDGGVAVLVTANPRPYLFPVRLLKRIVADTPLLGSLANRLRPKAILPYRPMPLGWMRRELSRYGSVDVVTHALPSQSVNQHLTEHKGIGKQIWKFMRWFDLNFPHLSSHFGCYVQVTVCKPSPARLA